MNIIASSNLLQCHHEYYPYAKPSGAYMCVIIEPHRLKNHQEQNQDGNQTR